MGEQITTTRSFPLQVAGDLRGYNRQQYDFTSAGKVQGKSLVQLPGGGQMNEAIGLVDRHRGHSGAALRQSPDTGAHDLVHQVWLLRVQYSLPLSCIVNPCAGKLGECGYFFKRWEFV